ncbi:hypothetical protein [Desulfospira joergensenii]|uniref:hypothetical protein n=1 Tax=Desulfospira joergensenii TaxID=53329 RepID=UPI0004167678|nr:hypothetical protein [Desulfospira joergensenii]
MKPEKKKLSGRVRFLISVLVMYGVTALFNMDTAGKALAYFSMMLTQVIPILGLVFGFLFLVNLFINPGWIQKHIGAGSGLRGWFYAVISGILISGPPYIIYPMLGELKKQGARKGLIAAMLYNRNVKPQFLPAMVYYFGIRYTVVLSVYIILFSLLTGKILEFFIRE